MRYFAIIALSVTVTAQNSTPEFEVASMRRLASRAMPFQTLRITPSGEFLGNSTLEGFIRRAWQLEHYERVVAANPAVARGLEEPYEINARPPRNPPYTSAERFAMFQRLLTERFDLKLRTDSELAQATVLRTITPGAYGRALRPAPEGCERLPREASELSAGTDPTFREAYLRNCFITFFGENLRGTATLDDFARIVSYLAQQTILNRTDLNGLFRFDVAVGQAYLSQQPPGVPAPRPIQSNGPSLVDALRNQMGLAVSQERQPIRILIVDNVGLFVEN